PRMVKRTFWTNEKTQKEYLGETFRDAMILLAETYNENGDKFPENPKKEVVILDIYDKTASVKLIADEWIDYMQYHNFFFGVFRKLISVFIIGLCQQDHSISKSFA
ncbi:MAG: hypothetical protein AAF599_10145, partial [Bacteroidota bacterium]